MSPSHTAARRQGRTRMLATGLALLGLIGCDGLLDVRVPGSVAASSLNDAAMMNSLAVGALGQVECAYAHYVDGSAIISDEYISAAGWRNFNIWGAKLLDLRNWGGDCQGSLGASNLGFWIALAKARFMADDAFRLIDAFPADQLDFNKPQMLARLAAYGGYSYLWLGEAYCEMAIDGGPLQTRAQIYELASGKFAAALQLAEESGSAELANLARVGTARSMLNLGRMAEAAAAARQVPLGFEVKAEYSTAQPRRYNRVYLNSYHNEFLSVAPEYRDLTVGGEPDTRVELVYTGAVGDDNFTPLFLQTKYPTASSGIPMASWREAQLIIAEAELGQSAVDRINALRDFHGLPTYQPVNAGDNQEILTAVIEERRRELFLEGHRLNDKLRHNIPFPTGPNHKNEPFGPITCMPLPSSERNANPNIPVG